MAKRKEAVSAAIQALPISNKEKKALQNQVNAIASSKGTSAISVKELDRINKLISQAGGQKVSAETTAKGYTPPPEEPGETPPDPYAAYLSRMEEQDRISAFALLQDTLTGYGLGELAPTVQNFLKSKTNPAVAQIQIRETDAWKKRFAGNEGRRLKGLAVYEPDEYLRAEETYRELLTTYGLDTIANQDTFSKLIGGAVSPAEAQDRIAKVFDRIDNADENLRQQLGTYFTQYGVSDPQKQRSEIAAALLGGSETAQTLQRQLQKAELRAGAAMSRYAVTEQDIQNLQQKLESAGVSDVYGAARAGFKTLAETEPTTQTLAQRYGVGTEALAEELQQEAFLGLQSQRRKKLQEQEKAAFAGQAGTTQVSLAKGIAGQI